MFVKRTRGQSTLEIILIVVSIGLMCLLYKTGGYRMIVLNLFYLPVVLSGFYLGRYRAGVLALFCVIAASVVTATNLTGYSAYTSPLVVALSVTIWGAVLGLTALLVGTLSDERAAQMVELHEAHVGVVEVLSRYLQSADRRLKDSSNQVAELSQQVALQLKLAPKEVNDIHVAALLYDMENIEITARVIRKAVGNLEDEQHSPGQHTFHGSELVHSLGAVMAGAFPLLLNQNHSGQLSRPEDDVPSWTEIPLGARIIRTVRAYVELATRGKKQPGAGPRPWIEELRRDGEAGHDPAVLHALERTVIQPDHQLPPQIEKALAGKPIELGT